MTNVQSKLLPISATCKEYVHPWSDSCWNSTAGLLLQASQHSVRIYVAVYLLSLLMRGRIPTKADIKRTVLGILQSSAFLSTNSFSFIMFNCLLRNILGKFYFISVAFVPSFMANLVAISVERPSRRPLLALYVSNVATETLWRMAVSRGYVRSIQNGQAVIFGISSSILLYFYRLGLHGVYKDSLFDIIRFVIGRNEEGLPEPSPQPVQPQPQPQPQPQAQAQPQPQPSRRSRGNYRNISFALQMYLRLIRKLKTQPKHRTCPHNHSCAYYSLRGGLKLFTVGFGLQVTLKLVLQLRNIFQMKFRFRKALFNRDTLKLGIFLGGFSFLYKSVSCALRHITGADHPEHAIAAGLAASAAFTQYPDTTIALYVMWKMLQITYNIGIAKDYVPKVPGFTVFLYCLSTAILFHAAAFEPLNLRSSYWKFLSSLSGSRVCAMERRVLDPWGFNSSRQVQEVMRRTQTAPGPIRFAMS